MKIMLFLVAFLSSTNLFGMGAEAPAPGQPSFFSYLYKEVNIEQIIKDVAQFAKKEVVLPLSTQSIKETLTIDDSTQLTAEQAWNRLYTYLELAGYTLEPRGNVYLVRKMETNLLKDTFPLFIGIPIDEIPNSDKIITYVYQLKNIQLPASSLGAGPVAELKNILEDIILDKGRPSLSQARILLDAKTNTIIVTGRAYNIKVAMSILSELDKTGYREVVEIVPLQHTNAAFVARFLREELLAIGAPTEEKLKNAGAQLPQQQQQQQEGVLFSRSTKIIEEPRRNALVVMGRAPTVEYLKDFIYKYIDIPLESGDSILHVYDLQYLEAETFAQDLDRILKGPQATAAQSRGEIIDRQFEDVIIQAERSGKINVLQGVAGRTEGIAQGGNRLVIAANKRAWTQIERLIRQLDKPQPQVSLEVLIVDVTLDNVHTIQSQMRNKTDQMPKGVNFQFAHIGNPVLNKDPTTCVDVPTTLATNLLLLCNGQNIANTTTVVTPGSALISFDDPFTPPGGGVWWLLRFLQTYLDARILSHPHVIALNNTSASNSVADSRRVTGQAKVAEGAVRIEQETIEAHLKIDLLPRINLSNTINLQIIVDVQDFIPGGENAKTIRKVQTNATVGNGEILVLGGLIDSTDRDTATITPLIGKIPIIGWFFKGRSKENRRNNLLVFICPTIITPNKLGGMTAATQAKFDYAIDQVRQGELFEQLKDPVTHWFFGQQPLDGHGMMHDYETREFFITKYLEKEPKPAPPPIEEKVDRFYAEPPSAKKPVVVVEEEINL